MEPAPEWTAEVEGSLAAVVATVLAAGRNAEAQPLWRFLRRGGRLPAGRLPRAALAGATVYEAPVFGDESARPAPDAAGAPTLQSASTVGHHVAALTLHGEVLCSEHPHRGLAPVRLPWPAAEVSCGQANALTGSEGSDNCYAVARQRGGGALCQWRLGSDRYGSGVPAAPELVRGLPPRDPVVMVEAGAGIAVALTASGDAYGWGDDLLFRHFGVSNGTVVRIPQLSGRRIRRLACAGLALAAETEEGQLLSFPIDDKHPSVNLDDPTLVQLPAAAAVAFPLRDMISLEFGALVVADAAGIVWLIDSAAADEGKRCEPLQLPPPARGQTVVRVAAVGDNHDGVAYGCILALTDSGELWCCDGQVPWESISDACPELPRGLLPYGGIPANRIMLLPDLSCGRNRVQLFARIAVRLGLPSDPVRTAVLRAAVQGCYIVGPEHDPYCWSAGRAADAAAAEQ